MASMATNRVLHGSNGKVWFDGELMANVQKIEVKVNGVVEDVTVAGDYRTFPQYVGYSVEGSVTFAKLDSKVLAKYAAAYKSGAQIDLTIVSALTDTATGKTERCAVTGAVLTALPLVGFEAQKPVSDEYAFKASDFDVLEAI